MNFHLNALHKNVDDERDFRLGALSRIAKLSDLPEAYRLRPREVFNQIADGNDDMCSAYAVAGALGVTEHAIFHPAYNFAASKRISGDPDTWGQTLRAAMQAPCKYGMADVRDVPMGVKNLSPEERRRFENFFFLQADAMEYQQKTYWKTSGPYSPYDNIRAWLFQYKTPIILGVEWGWDIGTEHLVGLPDGFGHALYAVGWNERGMYVVNSAGREAGKEGVHIMDAATVNEYVGSYGAFMHVDMPKRKAEKLTYEYLNGRPWWKKVFSILF